VQATPGNCVRISEPAWRLVATSFAWPPQTPATRPDRTISLYRSVRPAVVAETAKLAVTWTAVFCSNPLAGSWKDRLLAPASARRDQRQSPSSLGWYWSTASRMCPFGRRSGKQSLPGGVFMPARILARKVARARGCPPRRKPEAKSVIVLAVIYCRALCAGTRGQSWIAGHVNRIGPLVRCTAS